MIFYLRNTDTELNLLVKNLNAVGFKGYDGSSKKAQNVFIHIKEQSGYGNKACLWSHLHNPRNHIGNTPISINVVNYLSNFL